MPGLLGKKIGMTSIFDDEGRSVPCTVLEVGPCLVVDVRTKARDHYEALQLGFGDIPERKLKKPVLGQYVKREITPKRIVREFKSFPVGKYKTGDTVTVSIFKEGDTVMVTGSSKGKGFQGVMKRHGFGGVGMSSHGQSDRQRHPGSIGQSSYPSRVFPGTRMAGRMGNARHTVRGLKVVKVIEESNILIVKGAVPGAKQGIIEVHKQF
ncbi:MAG: 50S ribosomal protein L3 [Chlorobi bacterium]|nr:50S ribosomal protein L3 [Chlorobiota bacterium]